MAAAAALAAASGSDLRPMEIFHSSLTAGQTNQRAPAPRGRAQPAIPAEDCIGWGLVYCEMQRPLSNLQSLNSAI